MTCQSPERSPADLPKQLTPAFYHWKSTYNPTPWELRQVNRLNVGKVYLHFFDVDWDARTRRPVPKARIVFRQKPVGKVVPVVFITNRTLLSSPPAGLPELARNIAQMIRQLSQQNGIQYDEVQVDCDWTNRSRTAYFRLLTLLSAQLRVPLSATIRLHQIKYADQTGVPPVARGMLMLYNVADWKRPGTRNSIYDADVAGRYLPYVGAYPLPLDVVLPLFRWTIVYRNGRFLTFLNHMDRKTLANRSFLRPQADSTRFVARRDTVAFGMAIWRGDLFRAEAVAAPTLVDEKARLLRQIQGQHLTFALYHLDSAVLASYSRETLQTLFQSSPQPSFP